MLLILQKRGEHVRQLPRTAHHLDHDSDFQSQAEYARGSPPTLVRVSFSFFRNVTPILHKDLPTEICMLITSRLRYCNPRFLELKLKNSVPVLSCIGGILLCSPLSACSKLTSCRIQGNYHSSFPNLQDR